MFIFNKFKTYFKSENTPDINYNTLYKKLGGPSKINKISKMFYDKLLNDKRINHYFSDTNIDILISKQIKFLSFAFGGPNKWNGKSMSRAHKHLKITNEEFDIVATHFHNTLLEFKKIKENDIASAMKILETTRQSIVGKK